MPTTYIQRDTASDLSVPGEYDLELLETTATLVDRTIQLAASETKEGYHYTEAGIPGADGITGDYSVEVDIAVGDNQVFISAAVGRVNSSGTLQQQSSFSAEQQAAGAVLTFNFTNENLGTWATGDRLRVAVRYRNDHSKTARSVDVSFNTTDSEVVAPWEGATTISPDLLDITPTLFSPTIDDGTETATFIGATTAVTTSSVTSVTVPAHQDTVEGDFLIALVAQGSIISQDITATGWTEHDTISTQGMMTAIFTKLAAAGETEYTFNSPESERWAAGVMSFRDVDSMDVISGVNTGDSATLTCNAVTTTVDNAEVLRFGSQDDESVDPPSGDHSLAGHTEAFDVEVFSGARVSGHFTTQSNAGDTGTADIASTYSDDWATYTMALAPVVATGDTIEPSLLNTQPTLFSPTLNHHIDPSLINTQPIFFTPVVTFLVFPDLLSTTPTLFSPQLNLTLSPNLINTTPTLFVPEVATDEQLIEPPLLSTLPILHSPQVNLSLSPPLLSTLPQFFAPTLSLTVSPSLLDTTPSLFAPSLILSLQPGLIDSRSTLFTPSIILEVFLSPNLLNVQPTLFSPSISLAGKIEPGLLNTQPTLFSPTLHHSLSPPLLSVSPTLFSPSLSHTLFAALLDTQPTVFSPSLAQSIQLPLLQTLPSVFAPSLTTTLSPNLLNVQPTLFAPSIQTDADLIQPSLINTQPTLFTPAMAQASVPDADIDIGNWTTTPLFDKIDELVPNDTDFISSPGSSVTETCFISLSDLVDPKIDTGHTFKIRARLSNDDAENVWFGFELRHKGFTVSSWLEELEPGADWVQFEEVIGEELVNNDITDYSELSIRLQHNVFDEVTTNHTDVSWVQFLIPYSPNIDVPLLNTQPTLFSPNVVSDIGLELLSVTPTFFNPNIAIDVFVDPPLLTASPTFFIPFLVYPDIEWMIDGLSLTYITNLSLTPTYLVRPHSDIQWLFGGFSRTYHFALSSTPTYETSATPLRTYTTSAHSRPFTYTASEPIVQS